MHYISSKLYLLVRFDPVIPAYRDIVYFLLFQSMSSLISPSLGPQNVIIINIHNTSYHLLSINYEPISS